MLRQIAIVTLLNFRSLRHRLGPSLVIVAGMACVIGVLLSMLSFTEGMRQAHMAGSGDPRNALVVPKDAQREGNGAIPIGQARILINTPGIAKAADGAPLADVSFISGVPALSKITGSASYVMIRGLGPKGTALRPNFRIVQGRMFRSGAREFVAGERLQERLRGVALGDKVIMPDGDWTIVGISRAGDLLDGYLLGDTDTVMRSMGRNTYHSLLLRLESPDAFPAVRRALTANPAITVDVHRPAEWNARNLEGRQAFFRVFVYGISIILAIGALFGCVNTMHAAVQARALEIATLRALGYGDVPVAVSVLLEAALLCMAGALIGAAIAWGLYDGVRGYRGQDMFNLVVTPAMVGLALLWAVGVALLGGILPALRAARWTVADALRAR
jgi:putative ABC transport system permease protein